MTDGIDPEPLPSPAAPAPLGKDYVSDRAFADFPISEELLQGIHELGFSQATPVQAASIDPALAGADLLVRAKTGTGKTAAFCVPIAERTPAGSRAPYAIILEPTRELAQQTAEQLDAISRYKDVSVVTLVGGVAMGPQESALKAGAEIVVGTPGRVLDHVKRGNLDLASIRIACLDEADEMLSMGFYEDVTAILDRTAADRQILLFSATLGDDTQRLVERYLREPIDIMLSTDADGVSLIEHVIYETQPDMHKIRSLLFLLDNEDPDSAIIFCNTREDAATVATYLDRQGLDAQLLSGELTQARRSEVMGRVKRGEVRFLAATDVAARGIDISDLSHVVNYSLPQDPAVYLHRTGRTGRIGKKGTAISLVGGTDLSTRKILETRHEIPFIVRELPDAETAVRKRVERQARQIRTAMGTLVFESYLPTVRALLERPDGEVLLAAALRAFFTWDRSRRAVAEQSLSEALEEARGPRRRDDEGDGRGKRGKRDGRDRRDGRDGRDRDRGDDRGRRSEAGDRSDRRGPRRDDVSGLDDLLSVDTAPAGDDDGARKKKRRKRKKKDADAGRNDATATAAASDGELALDVDALLEVTTEASPAAEPAKPARGSRKKATREAETEAPAIDDLDALLDLD